MAFLAQARTRIRMPPFFFLKSSQADESDGSEKIRKAPFASLKFIASGAGLTQNPWL